MHPIAVVTGGSRGIGAACVRQLARDGYGVLFLSRSASDEALRLQRDCQGSGLDVHHLVCDVADQAAVAAAFAQIERDWHRVDVLVNNAGISHIGLFQDTDADMWRRLFAVNVDGVYHCTQAALRLMLPRHSGCILNMVSMWGEVGASCEAAYSATKAAVIGLSKALAKELGPAGIRVNCISPGVIDTPMNAALTDGDLADLAAETPLGRIGQPEEVARTVSFLAGEGAAFITGQVIGVSGGLVI